MKMKNLFSHKNYIVQRVVFRNRITVLEKEIELATALLYKNPKSTNAFSTNNENRKMQIRKRLTNDQIVSLRNIISCYADEKQELQNAINNLEFQKMHYITRNKN